MSSIAKSFKPFRVYNNGRVLYTDAKVKDHVQYLSNRYGYDPYPYSVETHGKPIPINNLDEFFAVVRKLGPHTPTAPCSFVVLNNDELRFHSRRACHADIDTVRGIEAIATSYDEHPQALAFLQFLLAGPFRKLQEVEQIDTEQAVKQGYIELNNLDKIPAAVAFNFLIASRSTAEKKANLDRWAKYCEAGANPGIAWWWSCQPDRISKSNHQPTPGHWCFNLTRQTNYGHWLTGDLDWFPEKTNWPKTGKTTPTNIIWGGIQPGERPLLNLIPDVSIPTLDHVLSETAKYVEAA